MRAIARCLSCGDWITSSFWLCEECEKLLGVHGKAYADWPDDVRELVSAHRSARYREGLRLSHEADSRRVARLYDWVVNGEANPDGDDDDPDPDAEYTSSRLRCCYCLTEFTDEWPTFPSPYSEWRDPVCPTCGRSMYVSLSF